MTLKGMALGFVATLCIIGSGIAETSKLATDDATSPQVTMAQMAVHE